MILQVIGPSIELSQGDLFDDVPIFVRIDETSADTKRSRAIVLTQTCDLAQSKSTNILVACIYTAQSMVDDNVLKANTIRDHVRLGKMFGLYFIPAEPELEIPELIVDLRDVHTIPRRILEELRTAGKRPATLPSPYREHLAQHFALTYMRIALPVPSETMPF